MLGAHLHILRWSLCGREEEDILGVFHGLRTDAAERPTGRATLRAGPAFPLRANGDGQGYDWAAGFFCIFHENVDWRGPFPGIVNIISLGLPAIAACVYGVHS